MEITQKNNKEESLNQNETNSPNLFQNSIKMNTTSINITNNSNNELSQYECIKNNFIQKRNRTDNSNIESKDKLQIDLELINKTEEINDISCDINMESPHPQSKLNHTYKKMSIDLDDDTINQNTINKKIMGCNCKNSTCLKRYCECFSRMKYCNNNCQCKNCFNNSNYEKERTEAIKVYLVKSPMSFKKINMDLNNITCNCKKSNCLKNYCECFQFGLKCTYNCGCVDCKNRNLLEKKLFFVENKNDVKNQNNIISEILKNKINIQNNIIKLKEEEEIVNNINNINLKSNNNNIEKSVNKTNINNPQFIVNKIVNNNINDNSLSKPKNRTRFLSFNEDASQLSKWSSINSKKIEISNNRLIIDNYNYNINQPDDIGYEYEGLRYNNFNNSLFPKYEQRNNNMIITHKNSAFSAIIK